MILFNGFDYIVEFAQRIEEYCEDNAIIFDHTWYRASFDKEVITYNFYGFPGKSFSYSLTAEDITTIRSGMVGCKTIVKKVIDAMRKEFG